MINNPALQGDMHSDTIIWRGREEPRGPLFVSFISPACSAAQAEVWEPHPRPGEGSEGSWANLKPRWQDQSLKMLCLSCELCLSVLTLVGHPSPVLIEGLWGARV